MILFAADTSGKNGSIALARVTAQSPADLEILQVLPLEGGTFSAQLIPQLAALLAQHGLRKQDLEGFCVASGPGSFTGLRVGLAAIKALAEVLGKPIAAVSLLQILAQHASSPGPVTAALDAGRGDVYAGEYRVDGLGRATPVREELRSGQDFVRAAAGTAVVTPDTGLVELSRAAGLGVVQVERPRSDAVARLGWRKIQAGQVISPDQLEANYIRRSDAEIFAKP